MPTYQLGPIVMREIYLCLQLNSNIFMNNILTNMKYLNVKFNKQNIESK